MFKVGDIVKMKPEKSCGCAACTLMLGKGAKIIEIENGVATMDMPENYFRNYLVKELVMFHAKTLKQRNLPDWF